MCAPILYTTIARKTNQSLDFNSASPCPIPAGSDDAFTRLVLDFAACSQNRFSGALGYFQTFNGNRFLNGSGKDHTCTLDIVSDDIRALQRFQIHHAGIHQLQFVQAACRYATSHGGGEAELRQTALQRLLTTLETGRYTTASTGFHTFVTFTGSLAEATSDTATKPTLFSLGARRGT